MNKRLISGKGIIALMVLFVCFSIVIPALGEEDGSGGGQGVPLQLSSSTPADGAKNVAVDVKIELQFNKNVINMSVRENNKKCFALYTGNKAVGIDVQMADDQVQPELKRLVTVAPRQALLPGTAYVLNIAPELQAKSEVVLGKEVKIHFTTVGTQVPDKPKDDDKKPAADQDGDQNNVSPQTDNLDPDSTKPTTDEQTTQDKKTVSVQDKNSSQVQDTEEKSVAEEQETVKQTPPAKTTETATAKTVWTYVLGGVIVVGIVAVYIIKFR